MTYSRILLTTLLLMPLGASHADDARYAPDWSAFSLKRTIEHSNTRDDVLARQSPPAPATQRLTKAEP